MLAEYTFIQLTLLCLVQHSAAIQDQGSHGLSPIGLEIPTRDIAKDD